MDGYLILSVTKDLKIQFWGTFLGNTLGNILGYTRISKIIWFIVQNFTVYFMSYCAKYQVSNVNFIFLPPTGRRYWATDGVIKKLFNSVLSAHRQRVYAVYAGVCSSYGVRETLSGHSRQTDGRTWLNRFLSSRWSRIYIYFIGSHMSPSTCYIHSAWTYTPFFLFLRESGLKKY